MKNKIKVWLGATVAVMSVSVQSVFAQSDGTVQQVFSGFHQFADGFKVNEEEADDSKSGITPIDYGMHPAKGKPGVSLPGEGARGYHQSAGFHLADG